MAQAEMFEVTVSEETTKLRIIVLGHSTPI
jgi:hypothetical protein